MPIRHGSAAARRAPPTPPQVRGGASCAINWFALSVRLADTLNDNMVLFAEEVTMTTLSALRAWAAAAAMASLMFGGGAQAANVSLESAVGSVTQGTTFQLRLHIDGFSGATGDSLAGFNLRLNFDPAAVSFQGFDFLDSASSVNQLDFTEVGGFGFLGDAFLDGASVVAFGLSGNSDAVLDASQADAFDLLRLNFRAEATAVTALFLIATADPSLLFVDTNASGLAVTFGPDRLAINITGGTLPTPGSASLALLALALLGGWSAARRRCRAALGAGLAACVALGSGSAAMAAGPAATSPVPAATAAAGATPALQGVVLEVVGQRIKVRGQDGQVRWYSATGPLPERIVNKPVRGVTRAVGDAVAIEQLSFE